MSTRATLGVRVRNDAASCVFTLVAGVFCILVAFTGSVNAKVFDRCELAQVLRNRHQLDLHEVATWTCIAQHSSGFNTEAYAGGLAGGSHGLFQISDVFWCSPPGKGFACNLPCERLRDADLTDDLRCLHIIYDEHQRLSGDGYNAWNAYQQFCRHGVESYVSDCFPNQRISPVAQQTFTQAAFASAPTSYYTSNDLAVHTNSISNGYSAYKRGKIYDRCELAQELYYKHKMPMEQIPTWVCIAQHESKFDTSAVGRLNADGSADHGLFQISDLYWCSHDRYSGGKACGLQCTKLLDNDISDDVRCIKRIHGEHTRISGDGFTAWSVYNRDCRNQQYSFISACFQEPPLQHAAKTHVQTSPSHTFPSFQAPQAPVHPQFQAPQTSLHPQFQANPFLQHIGVPQKSTQTLQKHQQHKYTSPKIVTQTHNTQTHKGKVYKRCELAQELYFKHKFPMQDIATWVCIAQHESKYDTAAVGRLNGDESADHGLFQISDLYWCAHDSFGGKACNIPCAKLLDSDITDDVRCIRIIHEEHTRISGDGFTAWTVYNHHCRNQQIEQVSACFDSNEISKTQVISGSSNNNYNNIIPTTALALPAAKGKIFKECELAQELYYKHKMSMEQIPTWVCIAKHESSFNTAAVGRLNADGSADHGLFQISDLYWCAHEKYGGKACNIPCHKLLDSDISDDVQCIKTIHAEHTRISGDGFTAWTVYNRNCRNQRLERIASCFPEEDLHRPQLIQPAVEMDKVAHDETGIAVGKGKIYQKCELAQELYFKHKMPMKDVPTWVCIAQYESSFNTAAVGRLNADGSADHGLFQISDLYWCSHEDANGKACHISCNKLLDNDITDDVRCVKTIYEEHTRLGGDGFTAWTVYNRNCRNQQLERISTCFDSKLLQQAQQANEIVQREPTTYLTQSSNINQITTLPNKIKHKDELNHPFVNNPFLNQFSAVKFVPTTLKPKTTAKPIMHYGVTNKMFAAKTDFVNNPFLNQFIQTQQKPHSAAKVPQTVTNTNFIPAVPTTAPYAANPFLSKYQPSEIKQQTLTPIIIQQSQKQSYHSNPFLSKYKGQSASFSLIETKNQKPFNAATPSIQLTLPKPQTSQQQHFHSNPFLSQFIEQSPSLTAHKPASTANPSRNQIVAQYQNNPFLQRISAASHSTAIKTSSQTQQQHIHPTSSSTEKTKLHAYPTKPYVNSEVFRTTPVKIPATHIVFKPGVETKVSTTVSAAKPVTSTTRKPHTQTTKQYYTTLLTTTTTRRPTTLTTAIRKPTANYGGSATKRPSTSWNWQQSQQVQPAKAISTTRQPTIRQPTTRQPTTRQPTTRQPTTRQPTTRQPTTRQPTTRQPTTRQPTTRQPTTRQPTTRQPTTRQPTTRQPTTRQPTTRQPTTRQPTTRLPATKAKPNGSTTRSPQTKPTTTKLSNNQKPATNRGSTPKSSTITTTTRKPQTTKNLGLYQEKKTTTTATTKRTTVSTKTTQIVGIQKTLTTTTTRRPATTQNAGLRKPTTAATTRKPTTKQSTTKPTSKSSNDKTANLKATTTRKPGTTVRTPITQKTTAAVKTTTKRPTTATKRATTNSKTNSKYSTTKMREQQYATTTTRKPTTTVRTPITQNTFAATKPPANAHPTRRPTTASLNNFSTTKVPYTTKNITKTTPFTQYTKPSTQKPKVTTTKPTALTKTTSTARGTTRKPALYTANATNQKPNVMRNSVHTTPTKASLTVTTAKYRDDPFSHPFFDKYKEQFKIFTTTTTRTPTSTVNHKPVQAHFGEESEYYKQFRNHASGSAKTVYAYAFGQNGTVAGHYGR